MNDFIIKQIKMWEDKYFIPYYEDRYRNNPYKEATLGVLLINLSECSPDRLIKLLLSNFSSEDLIEASKFLLDHDPYRIDHIPLWPNIIHQKPFPGYYIAIAHELITELYTSGNNVSNLKDSLWDDIVISKQEYWPEYLESILRPTFFDIKELYLRTINLFISDDLFLRNTADSILYGFRSFIEIPIKSRDAILDKLNFDSGMRFILAKKFLKT